MLVLYCRYSTLLSELYCQYPGNECYMEEAGEPHLARGGKAIYTKRSGGSRKRRREVPVSGYGTYTRGMLPGRGGLYIQDWPLGG